MKNIQSLHQAIMFRSKTNAHRYFYLLNGKLHSFVTDQKDALANIAALFGNLNAGFSAPAVSIVRAAMTLGALGTLLTSSMAYALPTGYESAAGNVQFSQPDSNTLNVTTNAQRSIANYRTFNIDRGETVNFLLPSAHAAILNRVLGGSPSQIFGAINSNGQVFLVNPSGILFGSSAQVNVGALFASTQNISNQDFLSGNMVFRQDPNFGPAAVVNQGNIVVQKGGFAVLAGSAVQNSGTITAPQGQVNLAVGEQISVLIGDNMAVEVTVDEALKQKVEGLQDAISNTGTLKANGGAVKLQAELVNNIYSRLINNEGVVQAQSLAQGEDGSITLLAHADSGDGLVRNAGTLDASGTAAGPNAGKISMDGDYVIQKGNVLAEGANHGKGGDVSLSSVQGTLLASGSVTSVRGAGTISDAGTIKIDSTQNTYFRSGALLDASGGTTSGNGGHVEVSGKESVYFDGTAKGAAVQGKAGSILIDPKDIVISNGGADTVDVTAPEAQADVTGAADEQFTESAGQTRTYNPQAAGTFNGFGDIHLQATNNITVNSPFDTSVATGNPSVSLKLEANNNININATVTTHNAALSLTADADTNGAGNLNINANLASNNGNITLQGNHLNLNQTVDAGTGVVTLAPTNTAGSIALGGAAGSFDVDNAELNRINASTIVVGSDTQNGRINVGAVDLSAKSVNLTLKTTGTITDADTTDDSVANLILAANKNLTLTGGVGGTGAGAIGAASGLADLDITTSGTGALSVTTNNAGLALESTGNMLIQQISAGSGNITLRANGTLNDKGGSSKITNTGSLTLTSNGTIGSGTANPLDVTVGSISVTSTGGKAISIRETGPMIIKSINTGGAGTIRLTSTSTIDDTDGGENINTLGNLILTSNGAIGNGAGGRVGTNVGGTVQVTTSGGNDIRLSQTGNLKLKDITTGGAGDVDLVATGSITDTGTAPSVVTTGNLALTSNGAIGASAAAPLNVTVGSVTVKTTHGHDISLQSAGPLLVSSITTGGDGNINLMSDATIGNAGATGDISTRNVLTLTSNGAIGTVLDPLRIHVGEVNVSTTQGNAINLAELAEGGQMLIGNINTGGTGNINLLAKTSIQDQGAGTHINTTGTLTLTANSNIGTDVNPLGINVGTITIPNANNINLEESSDMVIDHIAAAGNISLSATGSITDTGTVAGNPNIVTPGHLILTSNGMIGQGSADPLDIQVENVTVTTSGGNDISLNQTAGPLKVHSIQTGGAGNIFLSSADRIIDNVSGVAISTLGTLTMSSNGSIGSFFNPLGLSTGNVTVNGTGGNSIYLTQSGDLTVDNINTGGGGDVSLTATGGIFDSTTDGTTSITTDGNLLLTSQGEIGTLSNPLETHVGGLTIFGTAGNNVTLFDDHSLNVNSVSAGVGEVILGANGDLSILPGGFIQGSAIGLVAGGSINLLGTVGDANTDETDLLAIQDIKGSGTISGSAITLFSALGSIGSSSSDRVSTNSDELTANAASGNVYINHFGGGVELVSPNTALGDFVLTTVEPGDITVTGPLTAGNAVLETTGSSIFVNNAITGSNSVTLSAAREGDITGPGLISGTNVSLNAVDGNIIANTNASNLTVNTQGSTVNINESNSVNLGSSTSGGTFTLQTGTDLPGTFDPNNNGTIVLTGQTAATNIFLTSAGSILSATRKTSIRANGDSVLIANNGVLGTLRRPIRVNVRGGTLSVAATQRIGPYSGVLRGTVRPSNRLNILNNPPGIILFNGFAQGQFDASQVLAMLIYPYRYAADPNYAPTASRLAGLTTPANTLNVEANIVNETPTEQPFDLRLIEAPEADVDNGPVNYLLIDTSTDSDEKKSPQDNRPDRELRQ